MMNERPLHAALWSSIGGAAAALFVMTAEPATAQPHPRGGELQLNQGTESALRPSIAAAEDGRFIVVWSTPLNDVFWVSQARIGRFDALGEPIGGTSPIGDSAFFFFDNPRIDGTPDGRAVVIWPGSSETDDGGIRALRLDAAGNPLGESFQVNAYTTNGQYFPALAVQPDGAFMVVWHSYEQDGEESGVFARAFDSSGIATSGDFQVDIYTLGRQREAAVAALPDGKFVVAWHGNYPGTYTYPVFARRFDSAGVALAMQFQVSAATAIYPEESVVAAREDGAFVIVWSDFNYYSFLTGRRFDAAGSPIGAEFGVAGGETGTVWHPEIAMTGSGDFQVVWEKVGDDDSRIVFARTFDADAEAIGSEFQVNVHTTTRNQYPDVASDGTGRFVVVWERWTYVDAYFIDADVVARRYAATPPTLDVDGDGEIGALTDAVLVLRQRLGFTGSALTSGAVSPTCTRCDATEIEAYVVSILDQLDVDGDGEVGALTDALLIVRFGFGFRGDVLIAAAVGEECVRCEADEVEAFLIPLFA